MVNHSFCPPKEPVAPLRYMPNAQQAAPLERTEAEEEADMEYNARVLQKAVELKAFWAKRDG